MKLAIPASPTRGPCVVTLPGVRVRDIDPDDIVGLVVALGRAYGVPWHRIEVI